MKWNNFLSSLHACIPDLRKLEMIDDRLLQLFYLMEEVKRIGNQKAFILQKGNQFIDIAYERIIRVYYKKHAVIHYLLDNTGGSNSSNPTEKGIQQIYLPVPSFKKISRLFCQNIFFQADRNNIINKQYIQIEQLSLAANGQYQTLMLDGTPITVAHRRKKEFESFMNIM
ncbi:MAG: LytTR family transcriptional regulator DNA-binding domain-containing protein [Bacteroidota bacterium]